MEKHRGVVLGDTQKLCDVFSRALVEHAQRDHRSLNLAELRHARSEPQLFHRTRHELVGKRAVPVRQLELVDFIVRARSKVSPSVIARGVTDDRGENGGRISSGIELAGSLARSMSVQSPSWTQSTASSGVSPSLRATAASAPRWLWAAWSSRSSSSWSTGRGMRLVE